MLLPDPVGVERITLAPVRISMTASSCAGYSEIPRPSTQVVKASRSVSGSLERGSRSVSVIRPPSSPTGHEATATGHRRCHD